MSAAPAAAPAVTTGWAGAAHGAPRGAPRGAYVVFCGQTDLAWLRLLRPGFRHCFLAINDGRHWLTMDPLATFTELAVQPVPADFDLIAWYRARGDTVVPATIDRGHHRPAPWAPFTCVEAVKRALGIHARRVLTPYQLYRHLTCAARTACSEVLGAHTTP